MVHSRGRFVFFAVAFGMLAGLLLSSPAGAQTGPTISQGGQSAVGFQGGASIDPEQGFVGVFWESPRIAGFLSLRPGVDGGFGSDLRIATFNIDFMARFPFGGSGWSLVQGGGPVIVITKAPDLDFSETSAGFSYIFGFSHDSGFFGEFRIGSGSVPVLKMAAGYAIRF
jgi:hypothetical protein